MVTRKPQSTKVAATELTERELSEARGGSLRRESSIECLYFEDSVRTALSSGTKAQVS